MSETVIVKSFEEGRPWESDDGQVSLTFYDTIFARNGADFEATWGKKQGEPEVGESVEGEFYEKKPGDWRFRKAQKPGGGNAGRSSGRSTGKREWKPESQYDPEKTARIGRAHAQQMALRFLAFDRSAGGSRDPDMKLTTAEILRVADEFEADVNAAAKKAAQGAGSQIGGASAASTTAPTPAPAQAPSESQGDAEYLFQLLEGVGFNSRSAVVVKRYIEDKFDAEQRQSAVNRLKDSEQVQWAIQKLTAGAEGWSGEPLPDDDETDSIPF